MGGSAGKGEKAEKVKLILSINVVEIDFDVALLRLRVRGTVAKLDDDFNSQANTGASATPVRIGSYHTLELEMHRKCSIRKDRGWDYYSLLRVRALADPGARADLAVLLVNDGTATLAVRLSSPSYNYIYSSRQCELYAYPQRCTDNFIIM